MGNEWLGTLWIVGVTACATIYYVFKRYFEYKTEKAKLEEKTK